MREMKLLVVLASFIAIINGSFLPSEVKEFEKFEENYGKIYSTPEERQKRMNIFIQNFRDILSHNSESSLSYEKAINKFADLSEDEFNSLYFGRKKTPSHGGSFPINRISWNSSLPKNVDWRSKGATTEVKNQGGCGSCWAFAATEQIESYLKINTGKIMKLSTQQITSCAPNPLHCGGTGGCEGSIEKLGLSYANLFGMMSEKSYPYVSGHTGQTGDCKYKLDEATVKVHGYEGLPANDMDAVMNHLANVGPLAASVDASRFRFYKKGIFNDCSFRKNIDTNHAVQLVGYGTDPKLGDYWLVRNSWGPDFGEDGYIRIKRHSTLKCGMDRTPSHGSACEGDGIRKQKVCGTCGILSDLVYPIGVGF